MTDLANSVQGTPVEPPSGLLFHSGHTWVRVISPDLAFVGATLFAIDFAGAIGQILLPHEYHRLGAGEMAWTLVSRRGRKLPQTSPVGGRVLVVNADLLDDPDRLQRSPYQHGWILCIQSPSLPDSLEGLLRLEADRVWLERTQVAIKGVLGLSREVPFRNGRWSPAFGDDLSNDEWETLRHKLFPVGRHPGLQVQAHN